MSWHVSESQAGGRETTVYRVIEYLGWHDVPINGCAIA